MPSLTLIAGFRRRSLESPNALSRRYFSDYLRCSSQPTAAVAVIVTVASNLRLRGRQLPLGSLEYTHHHVSPATRTRDETTSRFPASANAPHDFGLGSR